jgi:hypothetical protein
LENHPVVIDVVLVVDVVAGAVVIAPSKKVTTWTKLAFLSTNPLLIKPGADGAGWGFTVMVLDDADQMKFCSRQNS